MNVSIVRRVSRSLDWIFGGQVVEDSQDLGIRRNIPLLPAEIRPADHPGPIDDVDGRPLAERPRATLDVVGEEDRAIIVGQDWEGDLEILDESVGLGDVVRGDADDLCPSTAKFRVVVAQLREMPPAERSARTSQEHQDQVSPTVEVGDP